MEIYKRRKAEENTLLTGHILSICSHCKNIRDEEGNWNQMEAYTKDRSEVSFSHGICPDCAKKLYPDIYAEMMAEKPK